MTTILITGANGFIGKNLRVSLSQNSTYHLLCFDKDTTLTQLDDFVKEADFIFHLAGVNRPTQVSEFEETNVNLTKHLIDLLKHYQKHIPVVATSSIHAAAPTAYGQSKLAMEELLLDWSQHFGAVSLIYRLPNVFGKWSKPHYNSVVSTFCYNISHDMPITLHDPDTLLELVYIDDVISEFTRLLNLSAYTSKPCQVSPIYTLSLKDLADKLYAFKQSRETLILPNFTESLDQKLYTTYLSYLDNNHFSYPLPAHVDTRGSLSEVIKSQAFGQIFLSETLPGITRGNHWHHTKAEKFLVIKGNGLVKLRSLLSHDILEYPVSGHHLEVIDIPPGYTHSLTNTGEEPLMTLFWSHQLFDPNLPDTYYEEVMP